MKIRLYTDYSVRLLVCLAASPGRLASIGEIALQLGISHNNLTKIAHDLRKAGFIEAVRGRRGGIRLARPPGKVSLGGIVRHTEKLFLHDDRSLAMPAQLAAVFEHALQAYLEALDRWSLADLVDEANPTSCEEPTSRGGGSSR